MTFTEYIPLAKRTAVYETREKAMYCSTTGLLGELGEYIDHKEKDSPKELIIKELGDICWYLANLSDLVAIDIENCVADSELYSTLEERGFFIVSKIQELLKKAVRDNAWYPTEEQTIKLGIQFRNLYVLIIKECFLYGIELTNVLQTNVDKLSSRYERGVIQGDGDER